MGEAPGDLGDTALADHLLDCVDHLERLQAYLAALVGEFDGRGLWAADGAVSAGQWIAGRAPLSGADARALVWSARRLRRAPKVAEAVADGLLCVAQGAVLAGLRIARLAPVFDDHEEALVDAAKGLSVDDTSKLARAWQAQADTDGPKPEDDDYQTARLGVTLGGRGRLEADLAPDATLIVRSVLEQIMTDLHRADKDQGLAPKPAARRRADALVEMARRASAAGGDTPAARPLIVIRCDLSDLFTRAGWQAGRPAASCLFRDAPAGGNVDHRDGDHRDGDQGQRARHTGRSNGDHPDGRGDDHALDGDWDPQVGDKIHGAGPEDGCGHHHRGRDTSGPRDRARPGDRVDSHEEQAGDDRWAGCEGGGFRGGPDGLTWEACGRPTTDTGQPVDPYFFRELLCDADLVRVITDAPSQVLDVGRAERTATAPQRRGLLVRDGGCVFPGCDRPPGWCHAHHLDYWEHGGRTDMDNLALLCNFHHRLNHRGGYTVARHPDGHLSFTRPDGTAIEKPQRSTKVHLE